MHRYLALCFVLVVAACATISNPITQNRLAAIESGYGVALSAAVGYRNACARKSLPPTCRPIVVQLQKAGRVAQQRVLELRAFVQQNPTLDATSVLIAAENSVQAFRGVQATYGVQ